MRTRARLGLTAALVLLGGAGADAARACSIAADADRTADAVFVGRVVAIEDRSGVRGIAGEQERTTLAVSGVRKDPRGRVGRRVEVLSPSDEGGGANCSIGFQRGRTYVVFAYEQAYGLGASPNTRLVPKGVDPARVVSRSEEQRRALANLPPLRGGQRAVPPPAVAASPLVARPEDPTPTWFWLGLLGAALLLAAGVRLRPRD